MDLKKKETKCYCIGLLQSTMCHPLINSFLIRDAGLSLRILMKLLNQIPTKEFFKLSGEFV